MALSTDDFVQTVVVQHDAAGFATSDTFTFTEVPVEGNCMIAACAINPQGGLPITLDTDWTEEEDLKNSASGGISGTLASKVAGESESKTATWNWSQSRQQWEFWTAEIENTDTVAPVESTSSVSGGSGSITTLEQTEITSVQASTLALAFWFSSFSPWVTDGRSYNESFTEYFFGEQGAWACVMVASRSLSEATAVSPTWTTTDDGAQTVAIMAIIKEVVIPPASTGATAAILLRRRRR